MPTVLIAATVLTGLVTGVFALYSHTIMPAFRRTDDRTFVTAFQAIDRAIINPWFMVTFLGGPPAIAAAGLLRPTVLVWTAFGLALAVVVITVAVHLPLNDALKAAGDPATIDTAQVRAAFRERRWLLWNHLRTAASLTAFLLLTVALTQASD
ncbi:putative membrane protein [Actinoplanes octamycinicus]|uniref:Putative membrane protein n=1 Tax=Actinoplanes octamycinicus TaxID=135948 RepID=A0A7W7MD18_9ACTN|nr:anthrone oxygenase family protein [Actinoplanes octamycinicus]MBB4745744.1 putative membrane protein [Actinoplanes octamycinicus]GIE56591.1 membrane protein [Actinoplanes octamycinicus]